MGREVGVPGVKPTARRRWNTRWPIAAALRSRKAHGKPPVTLRPFPSSLPRCRDIVPLLEGTGCRNLTWFLGCVPELMYSFGRIEGRISDLGFIGLGTNGALRHIRPVIGRVGHDARLPSLMGTMACRPRSAGAVSVPQGWNAKPFPGPRRRTAFAAGPRTDRRPSRWRPSRNSRSRR